jgi:hypothetical protein
MGNIRPRAFEDVFGNEERTAGENSERWRIARARVHLFHSFTATYLDACEQLTRSLALLEHMAGCQEGRFALG